MRSIPSPARWLPLILLPSWLAGVEGASCADSGTCAAAPGPASEYAWPHARGKPGRLGSTEYVGPTNLEAALTWKWHHPDGRFHTMLKGAPLLDAQLNIYLMAVDVLYKFNPDGAILWTYRPSVQVPLWNGMMDCPSLYAGMIFGITVNGYVFSVSMDTGKEIWIKQVYPQILEGRHEAVGGDTGNVEAYDGVVVSAGEIWSVPVVAGAQRVTGLNASTGEYLWEFRVETGIWNFAANFLEAGEFGVDETTVLFQDVEGYVYRVALHTGRLVWKSVGGAFFGGWTDGTLNTSPLGLVVSVTIAGKEGNVDFGGPDGLGYVFATNLTTGELVWRARAPRPPNSMPVFMSDDAGKPLVVLPIGAQAGDPPGWQQLHDSMDWNRGVVTDWKAWALHKYSLLLGDWSGSFWKVPKYPNDIIAYNAMTGERIWQWRGPIWTRPATAGDEEGLLDRLKVRKMFACLPCPWGYPAVDAAGTLYVGNQDGKLYALRQRSDNRGLDVVSTMDLKACFLCGSGGVTFGPGVMAVATCDTLHVFKT